MTMKLQDCLNELLMLGTKDLIQASELASITMQVGGAHSQDEVRKMSLDIIHEVVKRKLMEIGDAIGVGSHSLYMYESVHFKPWSLSFEEAMERVAREWKKLGRNPNLGEICWLCNTLKGNEIGERFLGSEKTTP